MPTLYPPDYPVRPDAPLLSFGPSFSQDIARSLVQATWHENDEQPHEHDIRAAAALTMLEAFHPRDHLEVMLAAQGVGFQCAALDSLARAARPGQSDVMVLKFRASAALMNRSFLATARELDKRQSRPLRPRPPDAAASPARPPPAPIPAPPRPTLIGLAPGTSVRGDRAAAAPARGGAAGTQPRRERAGAKTAPPPAAAEPVAAPQLPLPAWANPPEIRKPVETRPGGTHGGVSAQAPKRPVEAEIPPIPPIALALGTRPHIFHISNDPASQIGPITRWPPSLGEPGLASDANPAPADGLLVDPPRPDPVPEHRGWTVPRGPFDVTERVFSGESLARTATAQINPDAPPPFEDEAPVVEPEWIGTGGDPAFEAHRAALIAARFEDRPIAAFRRGVPRPP